MVMLYFKWNNVFTPYKVLLLIFGPDYISASNSIYQLFSDSQVIFAFFTFCRKHFFRFRRTLVQQKDRKVEIILVIRRFPSMLFLFYYVIILLSLMTYFLPKKLEKIKKRRCDRKKLDGLAFNLLKQTLKKSQ